ncbi:unnamed protein product [Chrysoparadoxa australica]
MASHGLKTFSIEYRDEFGRQQTQKEAFRQLSYRFHGHGPKRKKQEKRLKILAEERAKTKLATAGGTAGTAATTAKVGLSLHPLLPFCRFVSECTPLPSSFLRYGVSYFCFCFVLLNHSLRGSLCSLNGSVFGPI